MSSSPPYPYSLSTTRIFLVTATPWSTRISDGKLGRSHRPALWIAKSCGPARGRVNANNGRPPYAAVSKSNLRQVIRDDRHVGPGGAISCRLAAPGGAWAAYFVKSVRVLRQVLLI